jgi:ankyrin repeat protein
MQGVSKLIHWIFDDLYGQISDEGGQTVLHTAAINQEIEVIKFLLGFDPDLSAKGNSDSIFPFI